MSGHAIKLYSEGGLGFTVQLVHTGPCDQSANHDGECVLEDWVENVGEDLIHGEITVPVRVEWLNDDSPILHLQPNKEQRYREALEEIVRIYNDDPLSNWADQDRTGEIASAALKEETPDA